MSPRSPCARSMPLAFAIAHRAWAAEGVIGKPLFTGPDVVARLGSEGTEAFAGHIQLAA